MHRFVIEPLSSVLFIHMAVPLTTTDNGTVLVLYMLLLTGESIVKGNVVVVEVVVDVVVVVVDVVVVVVVITVNVPSPKTARLPAVSFR